jgi:hypothetical protein
MGAGATAWPGPFRAVSDRELPEIWHLKAETARLFEVIPFTTRPPPGADEPAVPLLLRRMLYVMKLLPAELAKLVQDINAKLAGHEDIAIRARLIFLLHAPYEKPWAFPAVLPTDEIVSLRNKMKGVADATDIAANLPGATPFALALTKVPAFAGFAIGHAVYMASLANRYYSSYVAKMDIELALRGIDPATLN